ncbi:hypothetical protein D3C80_763520 [compost metagenome]
MSLVETSGKVTTGATRSTIKPSVPSSTSPVPKLPARSVYVLSATLMLGAVPVPSGVNTAVQVILSVVTNALNVPPISVMSLASKPVTASLNVKLMFAVSPAARARSSVVIASVGGTMSTTKPSVASNTSPVPRLPTVSV